MQKIMNCLWFDGKAEEAANFYVSIFRNSKILETARFPEGGPAPPGSVLTVRFVLDGQDFLALNGGPQYRFSPAMSLVVNCEKQNDVDYFWEKLLVGGTEVQCGWLTDKFGVSWQIVPTALPAMLTDKNTAAAQRAFTAMMQMKKLDIAVLERAFKSA